MELWKSFEQLTHRARRGRSSRGSALATISRADAALHTCRPNMHTRSPWRTSMGTRCLKLVHLKPSRCFTDSVAERTNTVQTPQNYSCALRRGENRSDRQNPSPPEPHYLRLLDWIHERDFLGAFVPLPLLDLIRKSADAIRSPAHVKPILASAQKARCLAFKQRQRSALTLGTIGG